MTRKKGEQLANTFPPIIARNLIILAMGPSRSQCPFDTETWGVNNGYKQANEMNGRLDKLFLAHCQVKDKEGKDIFSWDEINNLGIDVINTHRVKGLNSRLFPMKRIIAKFECDYFSDTICYMLVYAIDQATTKVGQKWLLKYPFTIRLYGADMRTEDEYFMEKAGIEYWIGFARAVGIKIEITNGSMLCKTVTGKPYGQRKKKNSLDTIANAIFTEFLATSTQAYTGVIPLEVLDKLWGKVNNGRKV